MNRYTTPIEAFVELALLINSGGRGITFPFRDRSRARSFERKCQDVKHKIRTKRHKNKVEVRIYG